MVEKKNVFHTETQIDVIFTFSIFKDHATADCSIVASCQFILNMMVNALGYYYTLLQPAGCTVCVVVCANAKNLFLFF